MRRTTILTLFLLLGNYILVSQEVQWASTVIEFSSELTPLQYSAEQMLGKPNVMPVGGESPNAWTPNRANREEFVKLGFETATKVRQIIIGESYNASAITNIYLYEPNNAEHLITSIQPGIIHEKGRLLNVFIDETPYLVNSIKLEFNGKEILDYYSIDAVGISESNIPANVIIDLPDSLLDEIVVERLSENVNSTFKEYKPLLSPDGKTLFFSRQYHPENTGGEKDPEDIWYSELDTISGEWKKAVNAGPELNTKGPNYISSITPDGNSMVVLVGNKYKSNGKLEAGVSLSSNKNGTWSPPRALEIENDYNNANKANYFMTNNREVLLMSVMRDDSRGDRDLYVSFLKDDSTWTEPKNTGSILNTAGDEASPFLAADNKTLYFSSNGYAGFGGYDIYVSIRLDDSWLNWSDPRNMGPQINSQYEDLFFHIPISGNHAYYSRGIDENDTDVHRVELPVYIMPEPVIAVKGKLFNKKTGEPLEARIVYERLPDGLEIGMVESSPETGEFEMILPTGDLYGFRAEAEGFIPINENIDLRSYTGEFQEINRDLFLVPIEPKAIIVMNNIFFDFDKSELKEESFPELNRILQFLKEADIEIAISGHTDNIGPEEYNMGLSDRRANSVQQYFIKNGIAEERIELKFFGETKPIETNDTREGRSKNRRVEFEILEK